MPAEANIDSALAISAPDPMHLANPPADGSIAAALLADNAQAQVRARAHTRERAEPSRAPGFPAPDSPFVTDPAPTSGFTTVRYEIALTSSVRLTVPFAPDATDLEAIREAAAPLLQLLADRTLTTLQGAHDEY